MKTKIAYLLRGALLTPVLLFCAAPASHAEKIWKEKAPVQPVTATTPDFPSLAKRLNPSVVSIESQQKVSVAQHWPKQMPDPFGGQDVPPMFHFFFRDMPQMPRQQQGLGSGFVIDADGYVLTNQHVVENANEIQVTYTTANGTEKTVKASVVGSAPQYDVALLKTDERINGTIAYLGDSDAVRIGDWVMAIGTPFGLSHSVSVGIISAKGRRDIAPSGREGLYNFLQTDASINPGNSGGPLVNTRGEVIGINTAINAAGQGIGFAIPINMVKKILPQLREKGSFSRSWIGVQIQPVTEELAQSYGLDNPRGALVAEVVKDGPAEQAGIEEGDIILALDGRPVNHFSDLPLLASMAGVGKKVELQVWRVGTKKTLTVELGAFPEEEVAVEPGDEGSLQGDLGLVIGDITPDVRERLRLESSAGAVVKRVEQGSVAALAGLRPGDVISKLDDQSVKSARQLASRLHATTKKGDVIRLRIMRNGNPLFVAIRIGG